MPAEISVTVKAGPEYDAPWVVFKGSVEEVGAALANFRQAGLFGSVKAASAEFKAAPVKDAAQAVKALNDAGMGAQELPKSMLPKCPECGADGERKAAHSDKKNRDYEGIFCTKDQNHKPIEFHWTS
jgi:hypothetical protein